MALKTREPCVGRFSRPDCSLQPQTPPPVAVARPGVRLVHDREDLNTAGSSKPFVMGARRDGSATRLTQPSCGLGGGGWLGRWRRRVRGKVGSVAGADLVTSLRQAGVSRGELVALVISPALGLGLAAGA